MCDPGFTDFYMEMSMGVSLLRTAQSLLTGRTIIYYKSNKGNDQLVLACSFISFIFMHCSQGIVATITLFYFLRFYPVSVAEQRGLSVKETIIKNTRFLKFTSRISLDLASIAR